MGRAPDGWKVWLDWHRAAAPHNAAEIATLERDVGRYIGYVRVVGRRRGEAKLEEYCWPDTLRTAIPPQYLPRPLLRETPWRRGRGKSLGWSVVRLKLGNFSGIFRAAAPRAAPPVDQNPVECLLVHW